MEEILKGNFKVKNPLNIKEEAPKNKKQVLQDEVKKKVLASLGGSMVYVERTRLNWDGAE